ncbi:MAG: antitoxin [bacterium]|nr:antitoxin [bacterium]
MKYVEWSAEKNTLLVQNRQVSFEKISKKECNMKIQLDNNEKEILQDFDNEVLQPISNMKLQNKRYASYAKATLAKKKSISLRISELELNKLKARALEVGLPYQTLLSTLIHQFTNRKIALKL